MSQVNIQQIRCVRLWQLWSHSYILRSKRLKGLTEVQNEAGLVFPDTIWTTGGSLCWMGLAAEPAYKQMVFKRLI